MEEFKLFTDHKPLVPLINAKYPERTPLRYQRLLMRLMRYKAKAEYVPEKRRFVADALSGSPIQINPSSPVVEDVELHVHMVESHIPMSP